LNKKLKTNVKTNLIIRCLTKRSRGFGHLSRDLIVAKKLRQKKHKILFVIDKNPLAEKELKNNRFRYVILPNFTPKKESEFIIMMMKKMSCHTILIDLRDHGEDLSRRLFYAKKKIILIDDAWCKKAYADLVFNGTVIKDFQKYEKINKFSKLFLGPSYFITNPNFHTHKKQLIEIRKKKKYTITISIGGYDPKDLTTKIVGILQLLSNIKLKIIMGPFFTRQKRLENLVKKNKNMKLIYSPRKIWKEFKQSDLVISNAGNTLYELAIMRVPTLCIFGLHEKAYVKEFFNLGFAKNLGDRNKLNLDKIRKEVISILNNTKERKQMCSSSSHINFKNGLETIQIIDKFLKNKKIK